MRSIKFRRFDVDNNSMYQVYSAWFEEQGDYNQVEFSKYGPLMQYVGIHDRKGVEIYEGDILIAYEKHWKVVFSEACFWAIRHRERMAIRNMYCEVIGNIYQHPKLMYSERK